MSEGWLKRRLPKSLFGRALMIIMLPILMMQAAVVYIFFEAHWQTTTARLSDSVAGDVAVAMELYELSPGPEQAQRLDEMMRRTTRLSIALEDGDTLPTTTREALFSALDRTLGNALDDNLTHDFWFDTTRYPNHIDIRVAVDDGVIKIIAPRERVFASTGYIFLFWLIAATALLSAVSILFILNQARPIERLARATEAFGKGQDIGKFKPTGATEVRQASQAFLDMSERIQRHIQQRTTLLAGVSHDLRTPLTRLKLQLSMMDKSKDTEEMRRDIKDMEEMLDAYLDFARGMEGEAPEPTDLNTVVESVVSKRADHDKIEIQSVALPELKLRPNLMRRALDNLIGNACAYGEAVRIRTEISGGLVNVHVEDDGPGIDAAQYEEAFKPFQRLDESRSQNIKGVGLGLAISRDIAKAHGGDITLGRSGLGGLKATLSLPA